MSLPRAGGWERALRELAVTVPCLRAHRGALPVLDREVGVIIDPADATVELLLTDVANDASHMFGPFSLEHDPQRLVEGARRAIYAPHN